MIIKNGNVKDLSHSGQNEELIFDKASICNAIENNQFALYYQPQIDLPTGRVVGFEGLLRWKHPKHGLKLPEAFIPAAEQTGQIGQLTHIAIDTGLKFIEKLNPKLSFSLNISDCSIKDKHLVDTLDSSCQEFHIDPHRVVLEFTEISSLENSTHAKDILTQLNTNCFRLGIDDSVTGNYSLTQLEKMQFSELKIDKSLVATMEFSSKSRKSIISTIELADSLGIATIAEGIETNLEAIGLRELGCQFGQGYYFAKPMDEVSTLKWLDDWNKNLRLPI